jgi:hypothetical protein
MIPRSGRSDAGLARCLGACGSNRGLDLGTRAARPGGRSSTRRGHPVHAPRHSPDQQAAAGPGARSALGRSGRALEPLGPAPCSPQCTEWARIRVAGLASGGTGLVRRLLSPLLPIGLAAQVPGSKYGRGSGFRILAAAPSERLIRGPNAARTAACLALWCGNTEGRSPDAALALFPTPEKCNAIHPVRRLDGRRVWLW